jgi:competence protein ComER
MPAAPFDLGFIGTGNMGAMLIRAFIRSGGIQAENVWIANRSPQKLEQLAAEFSGIHCEDASHVARQSQILLIAVKPGDTESVLRTISPCLHRNQLCVFLTNVFSFEQLEDRIPCFVAKLIPTVVQQINRGVVLVAYGKRTASEHSSRLEKLVEATGKLLVVGEHQLRKLADITSCGPAFVAVCIEELCRRAPAFGLNLSSHDLAMACIETLSATAELLRSGIVPEKLVGEVAVPGGMTEAGITALRQLLPQIFNSVFSATEQAEQHKKRTIPLG